MVSMNKRKEIEKKTLYTMVEIYCRQHTNSELCNDPNILLEYAYNRLDKCRFRDEKGKKPRCAKCPIGGCYKPVMKDKIEAVMRYSGPRMMLYHPILAILHFIL